MARRLLWLALLCAAFLALAAQPTFANVPGAVFTTTFDGSRINANIYPSMGAVYLDGGPGWKAPAGAAALPPGDYYFQVTEPNGKRLLSLDGIEWRRFRVGAAGVITELVPPARVKGGRYGLHKTGIDQDHADLGAITIQLMPYDATRNPGGVYKVWVTPVDKYDPSGGGFHGFVPAWSKTDNFKVKGKAEQRLIVKKFNDHNANGIRESDEPEIPDWPLAVRDPLGVTNGYFTEADIIAHEGTWYVEEAVKRLSDVNDWVQTSLRIDESYVAPPERVACVTFGDAPGETHTVLFGNVQPGRIEVRKFDDLNANGEDDGEGGVPDVTFRLTGYGAWGELEAPIEVATDADGIARFERLLPGVYCVEEIVPEGWIPTTPTKVCGIRVLAGESVGPMKFGNVKPGCIEVRKFEDKNADGIRQDAEPTADFVIRVTGLGGRSGYVRELSTGTDGVAMFCGLLPGDYKVEELIPEKGGWFQTALWHGDGSTMTQVVPAVASIVERVAADSKVVVMFGNARPGCIEVLKFYDKDGDGEDDGESEPPVPGIRIVLSGGNLIEPRVSHTDEQGKALFCDLRPGEYTWKVEEVLPSGRWRATTPTFYEGIVVRSGETVGPYEFGNVCEKAADFGTKGFWHNQNGNPLITAEDIEHLNGLDPYRGPTTYWETPFGSREEISEFLVHNVSEEPHRFQLAQQLVAFVLNVRHYAGGEGASIALPGGTPESAGSLIARAITAWNSGDTGECTAWIGILDGYNDCDAVVVVHPSPCPVAYPN